MDYHSENNRISADRHIPDGLLDVLRAAKGQIRITATNVSLRVLRVVEDRLAHVAHGILVLLLLGKSSASVEVKLGQVAGAVFGQIDAVCPGSDGLGPLTSLEGFIARCLLLLKLLDRAIQRADGGVVRIRFDSLLKMTEGVFHLAHRKKTLRANA